MKKKEFIWLASYLRDNILELLKRKEEISKEESVEIIEGKYSIWELLERKKKISEEELDEINKKIWFTLESRREELTNLLQEIWKEELAAELFGNLQKIAKNEKDLVYFVQIIIDFLLENQEKYDIARAYNYVHNAIFIAKDKKYKLDDFSIFFLDEKRKSLSKSKKYF